MIHKLLIASGNAHKITEIKQILEDCPIEVFGLKDVNFNVSEPIENGTTFKENAKIKADAYTELFEGWILADDSGIVVDALDGDPGIFSARYAGEDATDSDNREKLKIELKKLKLNMSSAHFVCSLCLIAPNREDIFYFEEHWKGLVNVEEKGEGGFGYDPMFYINDGEISAAELSEHEKNAMSHRGLALKRLKEQSGELFK